MADIREQLAAPFPSKDIDWRIGSTNNEKTRGMALAYITARAVQERLDEVFGIGGWYDHYSPGPSGGVLCSLSCRIDGEWITKQDVADNSDVEPVKGGVSDALKRAAVKFGIGRYLYHLEGQWVEIEQRGRTHVMRSAPQLPVWALPADEQKQAPQNTRPPRDTNLPKPETNLPKMPNVSVPALQRALRDRGGLPMSALAPVLNVPEGTLQKGLDLMKAAQTWALEQGITGDVEDALMRAFDERNTDAA